jgi:hypothetical protein
MKCFQEGFLKKGISKKSLLKRGLKKPYKVPSYLFHNIKLIFLQFYYKLKFRKRTFRFQRQTYKYFFHRYNLTWTNERSVEVPIVWNVLKKCKGKNVLEVGNVLSHYFPVKHEILDKYEIAKGIINQDIVDFKPNKKYDLIMSISTLEHVGFDEPEKEPSKILRALENLKSLSNGQTIATVPLGFNPYLDKLLSERVADFKMQCMKKTSKDNEWIEAPWEDVKGSKRNFPFKGTNAIVILEMVRGADDL